MLLGHGLLLKSHRQILQTHLTDLTLKEKQDHKQVFTFKGTEPVFKSFRLKTISDLSFTEITADILYHVMSFIHFFVSV